MNTNQKNIGIGFWLQWVLASTVGFGVGAILGFVIPSAANINDNATFGILFGTVFGATGSLAHWLVLRRQVTGVNFWVPATILGFVVALVLEAGITAGMNQQSTYNPRFLLAEIIGVTVGLLQGLILRRQGVSVGWWFATCFLGSLLGVTLAGPANVALQSGEIHPGNIFFTLLFTFGAAFGVVLGGTTGGTLVWFLRNPKSGSRDAATMQGTR